MTLPVLSSHKNCLLNQLQHQGYNSVCRFCDIFFLSEQTSNFLEETGLHFTACVRVTGDVLCHMSVWLQHLGCLICGNCYKHKTAPNPSFNTSLTPRFPRSTVYSVSRNKNIHSGAAESGGSSQTNLDSPRPLGSEEYFGMMRWGWGL